MKYIELMDSKKEDLSVYIIAYCVMNNHIHMLIHYKETADLSKYMQKLNTSFAKYYNQSEERVGFVFRNRYTCEPILNETYLINCIKYIHNNPVKAKIVNKCTEYPYSSYKDFYNQNKIKEIKQKTGIRILPDSIFEEGNIGYFIDIDENLEEKIDYAIVEFCKTNNIEIYKLYESEENLKKLVELLKNNYNVYYIDIMKKFQITKRNIKKLKS